MLDILFFIFGISKYKLDPFAIRNHPKSLKVRYSLLLSKASSDIKLKKLKHIVVKSIDSSLRSEYKNIYFYFFFEIFFVAFLEIKIY